MCNQCSQIGDRRNLERARDMGRVGIAFGRTLGQIPRGTWRLVNGQKTWCVAKPTSDEATLIASINYAAYSQVEQVELGLQESALIVMSTNPREDPDQHEVVRLAAKKSLGQLSDQEKEVQEGVQVSGSHGNIPLRAEVRKCGDLSAGDLSELRKGGVELMARTNDGAAKEAVLVDCGVGFPEGSEGLVLPSYDPPPRSCRFEVFDSESPSSIWSECPRLKSADSRSFLSP
ncbi:hypothetical protein HHK36_001668 [Tetracentron sinense]|uniref:Uncharacterized protein n=1 Tax=Tetracentron sinense TaxID=13715 RepID=A0A835A347_TETSI|nr:hypothetical protein HHK36_001668 [Tetracentron sinense]